MEPGDVRSKGGFPATRHSAIDRIRDVREQVENMA
jgi:hypothetical protein